MSTIYLIRHADAGDPWEYPKDDTKRPLTRFGKEQAKAMAEMVKSFGIRQMFGSHTERCDQTLQTFHRVLRASIELTPILAPNRPNVILPFMRTMPQEPVLVCTHSDNIYALINQIHDDDGIEIPKRVVSPCGSFYVLERTAAVFTAVKYVPPDTQPPSPTVEAEEDDVWID